MLPLSIGQLIYFVKADSEPLHPYSWDAVHSEWDNAMLVPYTLTVVHFDRWIWIAFAYISFACLGLGQDAQEMYLKVALAILSNKVFPCCGRRRNLGERTLRATSWFESFGSNAKLLFSRKGSTSKATSATDSLYVMG